jgi:hypothetical protein
VGDDNGRTAAQLRLEHPDATPADLHLAYALDGVRNELRALRDELRADRLSREQAERERKASDTARTMALFAVAGAIIVALVGAIAGQALLGFAPPF